MGTSLLRLLTKEAPSETVSEGARSGVVCLGQVPEGPQIPPQRVLDRDHPHRSTHLRSALCGWSPVGGPPGVPFWERSLRPRRVPQIHPQRVLGPRALARECSLIPSEEPSAGTIGGMSVRLCRAAAAPSRAARVFQNAVPVGHVISDSSR